jgi:hypothetical protein
MCTEIPLKITWQIQRRTTVLLDESWGTVRSNIGSKAEAEALIPTLPTTYRPSRYHAPEPSVYRVIPHDETPRFRLIGRDLTFILVSESKALGNVPCVHGITADGTHETTARVVDIRWIS